MHSRSWIPNSITGANISVGFISMLMTARGNFDAAVYLLVFAIILDIADGKVARALKATSEFGKQLDGYCDLLSFGAAPAFLVHQSLLVELGPLGAGPALAYLLAGAYRLARFTLLSSAHEKEATTTGVPIPIAAGYLMVLALMRDQIHPAIGASVVVISTILMASRWRLPAFGGFGLVTAFMGIGMLNYVAVVIWPNWYTVAWWNIWNVVILYAAWNRERLGRVAST